MLGHPYKPELGSRALFPKLTARAYLNHSAISPPSTAVVDAVNEVMASYQRQGVKAVMEQVESRETLKARLARFIGAEGADEIAFIPNTSTGVLAIAHCLNWEWGDRVVIFSGEFPTNVTPWQRASNQYGVDLVSVSLSAFSDRAGPDLSELEAVLAKGVRLVAVSAVQFQTGLAMPLEEIGTLCKRYGAELFVDGIQAVGSKPLDVGRAGIDYMSVGSHKWLMGLEGAGFLYAKRAKQERLIPRLASWLSHEEPLKFLFGPGELRYDRPIRRSVDFLEYGAPNATGIAALGASFDLIEQIGVVPIYRHISRYLDALETGLVSRGFTSLRLPDKSRQSAILSVKPPAGSVDHVLARGLDAHGIACTHPDGVLRFAPHWPNAQDEVAVVLDSIDKVCHEESLRDYYKYR